MQRTNHTIARVIAVAGLATAFAYLVWRVLFSLGGTDLWLSIPVLLVEVAGFVGSALLVWALWPQPVDRDALRNGKRSDLGVADVAAFVRVNHQGEHELRATLIALRSVANVSDVIVVDASDRALVASLATELQATYVATEPTDVGGLRVVAATVRTARFLLLDAGDVPTSDIVAGLARSFGDERVAVVQGLAVSFADDSIEYGTHGRHHLSFERAALNPALGARGSAVWTGSGSLVSVDALREALLSVTPPTQPRTAIEMHWELSAVLMRAGWRVAAPAEVAVVAQRTERIESVMYADRCARIRAARRMAVGCKRSFTWRQRIALLAWCVRPLSGLRRSAFVAVVAIALYVGASPFNAPLSLVVTAWLPGFVATAVGVCLLSGWTLRPGDRTRWSLLSIGPVQNGTGLVVAITALTVVLVLRGISDQFTHALGRMPREALMAVIFVALWSLALSLDAARLLAHRSKSRRSARVVSVLPAILGDRSAKIVDLTPHGAGLLSQTALTVGERASLIAAIPTAVTTTASGCTEMRVSCVVGSVVAIDDGCWRLGVRFECVDDALANALSEFCLVQPMLDRLNVSPGTAGVDVRRPDLVHESDDNTFVGSGMLRFMATGALFGAVASSVSGKFETTRWSAPWLAWLVVAFAGAIGVSMLVGLIRPRLREGVDQALMSEPSAVSESSSSFSPDLAIR